MKAPVWWLPCSWSVNLWFCHWDDERKGNVRGKLKWFYCYGSSFYVLHEGTYISITINTTMYRVWERDRFIIINIIILDWVLVSSTPNLPAGCLCGRGKWSQSRQAQSKSVVFVYVLCVNLFLSLSYSLFSHFDCFISREKKTERLVFKHWWI